MVTYALLASLTVTSFFSMVTTRYIADMLYEGKREMVLPSLLGICAILLVLGGLLYSCLLYTSTGRVS